MDRLPADSIRPRIAPGSSDTPVPGSQQRAFFLAEQNTPGRIVEHGPTEQMFTRPVDPRTEDHVNGRFG